jgi:AcrR family transcriptional regulator
MNEGDLVPAPSRGAYDRSLSRADRDAQQCERLIAAASQLLLRGEHLTVASIASRARVSRTTFYEFFDDPEHLLQQIEQRVVRALDGAFERAAAVAPPRERYVCVLGAWLEQLEARPMDARVALTTRSTGELFSPAGKALHGALGATGDTPPGSAPGPRDERVLAAAAALEMLTRQHLAGPALPDALGTLRSVAARLLQT